MGTFRRRVGAGNITLAAASSTSQLQLQCPPATLLSPATACRAAPTRSTVRESAQPAACCQLPARRCGGVCGGGAGACKRCCATAGSRAGARPADPCVASTRPVRECRRDAMCTPRSQPGWVCEPRDRLRLLRRVRRPAAADMCAGGLGVCAPNVARMSDATDGCHSVSLKAQGQGCTHAEADRTWSHLFQLGSSSAGANAAGVL